MASIDQDSKFRPAGYEALIGRFGLEVIPNWHRSSVTSSGSHRAHSAAGVIEEVYPASYWPGDEVGDHLEFALKYDGTNLAILASLFQVVPQRELLNYVQSKLTGKYARRVWFLYEFLTGDALPLADLKRGNYVDLLDPEQYYTVTPARQVRRQRINDNLLGDRRFCPTVRRTDALRQFEAANFTERCQQVVAAYSPELLKRALSYLYTKETKSSFEIEHIQSSSTRTERFIALLQLAEKRDFCEKSALIELQNRIVDSRFQASDYRRDQNYVGESVSLQRENVHFAGPKPLDVDTLMSGLIAAHQRMQSGETSPVVHAAATSFGFVFLHPFDDGNGRIHRFLIHNILARRGFTPEGIMFPISASMLRNLAQYDASLEAFSRPLMTLVDYSLDADGTMTVHNDTAQWYAYIDMTVQAEALFRFIDQTIERELVEELTFLSRYDEMKKHIQAIVDMPDRQIDLLIRLCLQNQGRLSAAKRSSHFEFLSEGEVASIERAVQATMHPDSE
jgi:Fic family protein